MRLHSKLHKLTLPSVSGAKEYLIENKPAWSPFGAWLDKTISKTQYRYFIQVLRCIFIVLFSSGAEDLSNETSLGQYIIDRTTRYRLKHAM